MQKSNLSILIISFNGWSFLDACIRTIIASSQPAKEIMVIDNASVDGTPEKLRAAYPQVRLIQNSENVGHTRAVNQGLKQLSGDYILLLDADTELGRDAIKQMMNFLDEHSEICMAVPRILNSDGTIQESARKFPTMLSGIFGRQSLLTRLFPKNPFSRHYLALDTHAKQTPFLVEHVSSACMLFRKSIVGTVGEWDEGFKGYWNDADWCIRIKNAGEKIYCIPQAVIIHNEQNSRSLKKSPFRIILFHTGAYRFYRLHYTLGRWDPRSMLAAVMLTSRAILLLKINSFKKTPKQHIDPLSNR